ncbi:TraL conjugative transposon family protein [Bacteroides stercorirosoris]|uniref:TraL conjugative transposon family protein n=1 Tax=Bacteroides stercorirosoris TaxID=871324 RepID=UPI00352099F3
MARKRNYIEKVQDWADDRLRRMCGRITPGKRLAVILVMFFFFGGLSIYITVSSIYNIGKQDGERLQIEHIKQLPLHRNDTIESINPLNR